jgi:hypothetical protein
MAAKKKARKKKTIKLARKAKRASAKKSPRKKAARKGARSSGGAKLRSIAAKAGAVGPAATLGDWTDKEHETEEFTEDDIPPEYGGSE